MVQMEQHHNRMVVIKLKRENMKSLFILLLTLLGLNVSAQSPKRTMSDQEKVVYQSELEKYYGTWVYEENGESFTIVLKHHKNEKLNAPFLTGNHIYKQDLKVVDGENKENTISSGVIVSDASGNSKIRFRFRETSNPVNAKGTLEFKDGNQDILVWKLVLTEGAMVYFDGKKPDYKLHVPSNIVLKRVK